MTKKRTMLVSAVAAMALCGEILAAVPRVFTLDGTYLEEARTRIAARDEVLMPALGALQARADKLLASAPEAVTRKGLTPPSGDKHDYMSMGPYWWPDASKPNGLPYVQRDGQINPSSKNGDTDSVRMQFMCEGTRDLALAYYLTGNKVYAEKAAAFIRTWFLDPATRMNPNLRFGQAVPGVVDGRGIGLIDTRNLWMVIDALGLIESANLFKADDMDALRKWFSEFTTWMIVSPEGHEEATWHNNHGAFYDAQVANYALFIDDKPLAKRVLQDAIHTRMAAHFAKDGRQYAELERTQPYHYSAFNLEAHLRLARYGEQVGVDYANAVQDGRTLQAGVGYLLPYLKDAPSWPYKDLKGVAHDMMLPVLLQSMRLWPAKKAVFAEYLSIMPTTLRESTDRLLWPVR